jgi:hypothetical protein
MNANSANKPKPLAAKPNTNGNSASKRHAIKPNMNASNANKPKPLAAKPNMTVNSANKPKWHVVKPHISLLGTH